ncbi:MAG: beta-1,6-N-acetylglucosaminyltransferase [Nibricoccus sp.]
MPLAFHVLAHTNPELLTRSIEAMWAPQNLYVVHYDRRRPQEEHAIVQKLAAKYTNVVLQPPRPVLWGRFSLLQAQLDGLRIALAQRSGWTHWINLSGQCFPLQTPERMEAILSSEPGLSSVNAFDPLTTPHWPHAIERLSKKALDLPWLEWLLWRPGLGRRLRRLFGGGPIPTVKRSQPKPPPPFARWYGGDNWVVLARNAAEYVASAAVKPLLEWFSDTLLPEESFFQTAVMNSPEPLPRISDHRRELLWHPGDISPSIFRTEHTARLEKAAQAGRLFARKFNLAVDAKVIDFIERRLLAHATA